MNKIILLLPALFLSIMSVNAQVKGQTQSIEKTQSVETGHQEKIIMMQPQFKTTSTPKANVKASNQVLLQELYLIEDERHRAEKNQSLSQSQRSLKIQENNTAYANKKQEFMSYVDSKGILNVTKQEQNYYLYLLKYDKKQEEYIKNINLIKNSK
jgi:hypothetical protein